jgi:hypothetical protein
MPPDDIADVMVARLHRSPAPAKLYLKLLAPDHLAAARATVKAAMLSAASRS